MNTCIYCTVRRCLRKYGDICISNHTGSNYRCCRSKDVFTVERCAAGYDAGKVDEVGKNGPIHLEQIKRKLDDRFRIIPNQNKVLDDLNECVSQSDYFTFAHLAANRWRFSWNPVHQRRGGKMEYKY